MTEPDTLFQYDPLEWLKPWQRHTPPSVHHSETSMDAAFSIKPKAPSLRERVYELLKTQELSDEQIAQALNLNPNTARPRRVELANMGLIEQVGVVLTSSGMKAALRKAK